MFERAKNRMAALVAVVVVAGGLVACGGDKVPEAPGQSTPASSAAVTSAPESSSSAAEMSSGRGVSDVTGTWTLSTIEMTNGGVIPIPEQANAGITVVGSKASITTGCNTASAEIGVVDNAAVLGPVAMTRMACPNPDLQKLEDATLQILDGQPTVGVVDDQLTIDGDAGTLTYNEG